MTALEARAVTFAYAGTSDLVIRDIDLTIDSGEMVAVTGPSGCGKSTLLFMLGLFLAPSSGEVALLGRPTGHLSDADRSRLRAHEIGFVFQDAALHPSWTIGENVAEGALYGGASHGDAAARTRALLATYGIESLAERRANEVSGGQAQRAALCRALLRAPSILLADEPTGNLDPENAAVVLGGLQAAARDGAAVLVVTHSPEVAMGCDRTVSLA